MPGIKKSVPILLVLVAGLLIAGAAVMYAFNSRNHTPEQGNRNKVAGVVTKSGLGCTLMSYDNSCFGNLVIREDDGKERTVKVTVDTKLPQRFFGNGRKDVDPPKKNERVEATLRPGTDEAISVKRLVVRSKVF